MPLNIPVPQAARCPRPRQYLDGLRYGIELEYEGWDGRAAPEGWRFTGDGSLRDNGVEFVSQPVTYDQLTIAVRELVDTLRGSQLRVTPRCGMHVHMNMRHLTVGQLYSIMTAYTLLEPALFRAYCPDRETSSFCVPVYRNGHMQQLAHASIQSARGGAAPTGVLTSLMSTSKYSAMNAACLRNFGTLEFRHMPSTMSIPTIMRWVDALTQIHDVAINHEDPLQVVAMYEGMGPQAFYRTYLGRTPRVPAVDEQRALVAATLFAGFEEPRWEELLWEAPAP